MVRPGPLDAVRARLADRFGPEALAELPHHYFRVGDVLLLDLPIPEPEREVARAYAEALHMRSVLGVKGGIEGELRTPVARLLWGDQRTETVHVENGLRFALDPAKVMWSHGNLAERRRVQDWDCRGETVVDLFAGVGYFTVPVAAKAGAARVVAIEKNPVSFGFLERNLRLNGVDGRVEARLGDCRDVAPVSVADRVLLGYLPDSLEFVPAAVHALKPSGGRLHVHRLRPVKHPIQDVFSPVKDAVERLGRVATLERSVPVKSYGPGHEHVVLDVAVGPSGS